MMDLEYITENDVVDRYVLDQLTEREQVEFELYFLSNPEILDDVEIARALQIGLAADLGEAEPFRKPKQVSSAIKLLAARLSKWFESPVVLTVNFSLLLVLAVLALPTVKPSEYSAFSASRVWVGQVRGAEVPIVVELSSQGIILDIDVQESGVYEVTLLNPEGAYVRQARNVVSVNGALLIAFESGDLAPGVYTLKATMLDGGDEVVRRLDFRDSR